MTTRKNPGLSATMAAALAVGKPSEPPTADVVKAMSLRVPLEMWGQLSELSLARRKARGGEKRVKGVTDPASVHGMVLTAISEYLARQA